MEFLLGNGASVDALDNLGRTPLHRASLQNNTKAIQLLLQYNADATLRSEYGQTPLDVARGKSNKEAIEILEKDMRKSS